MSASFSPDRLAQVLLAPVVSEKSTFVGVKRNQVVFRVASEEGRLKLKAKPLA